MCPPIGFRAPPATNVMVAPGSAIKFKGLIVAEKETLGEALYIAPDL